MPEFLPLPQRRTPLRVLLVTMPMAAVQRPSIQIGLLAALGRRAGHQVDTLHANLDFAATVNDAAASRPRRGSKECVEELLAGRDPYSRLAEHRGAMFGEWIFAAAAFGAASPVDAMALLDDDRAPTGLTPDFTPTFLRHVREELAPLFIRELHERIDWGSYDLVGFSSTFHQNCASFALARALKASHPQVTTVFGGANFESVMGLELLRLVPSIDIVVRGEADTSFPALLDVLARGGDPRSVPGVAVRDGDRIDASEPAAPIDDLETQPVPMYDEYFERADNLGLVPASIRKFIDLPFESARGCWWGAKRHCTFCGLNGATMRFRSRSAERVRSDLDALARRHGSFRFTAVDNIIERSYFDTLLPQLENSDYDVFYEVKADLSAEQLRALRRAGVRRIQPGIESLSSHVLGLMRKGTRASWNVNLLRWCRHLGIDVSWNVLWGFPDERPEDYAEQAALVPHLIHLQPPVSFGPLWWERFSPLFQERVAAGATLLPERSYALVYPAAADLGRLAYFFEGNATPLRTEEYSGLSKQLSEWQASWPTNPPELTLRRSSTFTQIIDTRSGSNDHTHTLEGTAASLYDAFMETPRTIAAVADELGLSTTKVQRVLDALCEAGLSMRDRTLYLSLAVPARK